MLEKRKANVTFLSYDSVMITNYLYQKTFVIDKPFVVDLHSLKKIKIDKIGEVNQKGKVDSPFFIFFNGDKKNFYGVVVYKRDKDRIEMLQDEKDQVSMKNNNKNFSATVYVED